MSNEPTVRVPLRLPSATATFVIGIAGCLCVNLSPYLITTLQEALGSDVLTAGWIITATLLASAVTGLALAPICAGPRRVTVARAGLSVAALGFGVAALVPTSTAVTAGLIVGGLGAGCAVAVAGASLAAFTNPDRVAGMNGTVNRAVIGAILAALPLVGLAPINVFGALAIAAVVGIVVSGWLPAAPLIDERPAVDIAEAMPVEVPPTAAAAAASRALPYARAVRIAGYTLLATFALWAVTEESLWAMASIMAETQASLSPEGLSIALSGAAIGGVLSSALLVIVGDRLGRAVPLAVLLVTGGALKIVAGFVTTPTAFIVILIAWSSLYAVAFMYFLSTAAALDPDGRWSARLLSIYLVGSSVTPIVGAALTEALGFQGFGIVLGVATAVLAVPAAAIAHFSTRCERAEGSAVTEPQTVSA